MERRRGGAHPPDSVLVRAELVSVCRDVPAAPRSVVVQRGGPLQPVHRLLLRAVHRKHGGAPAAGARRRHARPRPELERERLDGGVLSPSLRARLGERRPGRPLRRGLRRHRARHASRERDARRAEGPRPQHDEPVRDALPHRRHVRQRGASRPVPGPARPVRRLQQRPRPLRHASAHGRRGGHRRGDVGRRRPRHGRRIRR